MSLSLRRANMSMSAIIADPLQVLSAAVEESQTPGLQYRVVNSAGTKFHAELGLADIRRGIPMGSSTAMMAYSMSKTITAAAVLQLISAGRVGLDDPLEVYEPRIPYGARVTIRQLLAHTSGIPNPIPLRWVHLAEYHSSFDEDRALNLVLARHGRLAFEPGTKYQYSNIGYWLLGRVVASASGQPFPAFVDEHLFRPLRIAANDLCYAVPSATLAAGYLAKYSMTNLFKRFLIAPEFIGQYVGDWLCINSHYLNGAAFGGLVGNTAGVGALLQDQLRPHSVLFDDDTKALFYTQQSTTRGVPAPMTLGWHVGVLHGIPFYFKEGGGGGFHCEMRLYPDWNIGSVMMANATGFDVKRVMNRIDPGFSTH
jgi:CubicO group peptidase (beta-lactamase class C family)